MPNRFLKESICTSENIDRLTPMEEIFFYRLIVNCDDYGRMDARLKLLASKLFPLKEITLEEIRSFLNALAAADLIFLYEVDGHPFLQMKTWGKHQQTRANKSKYPDPAQGQKISDDNKCYQEISDDNKCPRIRIRNTNNDNDKSITSSAHAREDDDVDAFHQIQGDHDRVLDAAEDAGFRMSNDVRATLIALYAEHGLQKILDGLKSCVEHGAPNLAYLKAVLRGEPKKQPEKAKAVNAQQYAQRDYANEQEAAMARMIAMGGGLHAG